MKDEIKIFGYREPEKIADTVLEIPGSGLVNQAIIGGNIRAPGGRCHNKVE